jgi:hypothetical protein
MQKDGGEGALHKWHVNAVFSPHLVMFLSKHGGARTDVNVRIQKARGSFSKLRKEWLSPSIQKDTKISIFNACMKSVLLYGCKTWLVTSEI